MNNSLCKTPSEIYKGYIHISRYAKFIHSLGHREFSWGDTVKRFFNLVHKDLGSKVYEHRLRSYLDKAEKDVLNKNVLPSMRFLSMAGPAVDRDNTCIYNCAYLPMDCPRAFVETLFILMQGTGVGYSVERRYTSSWPDVPTELKEDHKTTIVVHDSTEGWCLALDEYLEELYLGDIPKVDYSQIRPAGTPLKTKGGRASGPEPLKRLFEFIKVTFQNAKGRRLNTTEIHDIQCMIADIVVVGGVRRSAMISLGDWDDPLHAALKSGEWYKTHLFRSNANNSAVLEDPNITEEEFKKFFLNMYDSKSGERGIFNRVAARRQRGGDWDYGCNPCSEIILRPRQFCNLSTVVISPEDTKDSIIDKLISATLLGTIQSMYTSFPFLESIGASDWKKNCDDERLLGVSKTGIMDNLIYLTEDTRELVHFLKDCNQKVKEFNIYFAKILRINPSAARTCIKPEGTTSSLTGTSPGLHPGHSKYYIRRAKSDIKDPLCKVLIEAGIPNEPCHRSPDNAVVFEFPMKSSAFMYGYVNPVFMVERYCLFQRHYCDHKPSITIPYKDKDFAELEKKVWSRLDEIIGISFFPHDDHVYTQTPYEAITEEEYLKRVAEFPESVDFRRISVYEKHDTTVQTFECTGASCAIIDQDFTGK